MNDHTEKRIEALRLLQRLKRGDERPGHTILRALRTVAERRTWLSEEEVGSLQAAIENLRSCERSPQIVEAAWRIASNLEAIANRECQPLAGTECNGCALRKLDQIIAYADGNAKAAPHSRDAETWSNHARYCRELRASLKTAQRQK